MTEQQKILHLLRRGGFGPSVKQIPEKSLQAQIDKLMSSNKTYEELFLQDEERITTKKLFQMTPEERKEILQDLAANVKKLNLEWLKMMGKSEGQLREKMSLFWHGHFAVRVRGFAQAGILREYNPKICAYRFWHFADGCFERASHVAIFK
ncbi:MAG: DUF1800 family protein [Bacteroidia bacterium]